MQFDLDSADGIQAISATSLPLPTGASTEAKQTQPGVDIGDVTINNASGASSVNIQDGGNSITVDGNVAATQSGTWTVQPGNTANTTAWKVDGSSVTQPVSAASLPLPTGSATAANQSTEISSLSSIDTKLTTTNASLATIDAGIPAALGQTTMSASMPVVIANNQSTVPVSGSVSLTGTNTVRCQDNFGNGLVTTTSTPSAGDAGLVVRNIPSGTQTISGTVAVTQSTSPWVVSTTSGSDELATFVVQARDIATGNGKSMLSLLNASGSTVKIKLRDLKICNVQNTAVTGVVSEFGLYRITGHSVGTSITPASFDTSDSLNGSVTARTGSTVSGESTNPLLHWDWSNDEWGSGAADVESSDHAIQEVNNLLRQEKQCKPITLRAGEGITIKHVTNSTVGLFDVVLTFTQETA